MIKTALNPVLVIFNKL